MLTAEQAVGLCANSTQMLEGEIKTTRKMLAAVPDSLLDWKAGEKGMTTRDLMWHIATSEAWFAAGIVNGKFSEDHASQPAAPATTAEIVAWYDQTVPAMLEKVRALPGEDLAREVNFFNVFNLPAVMYLNFCNSHSIHHRGQLSTYLRVNNAHVPSIYGGSADEPFEMPASA